MPRSPFAAVLFLLAVSLPIGARADRSAFALADLVTPGRVLEAFALRDAQGQAWLAAVSAEQMPPEEKRVLTLYPRGLAAGRVSFALAPAVAALDVADIGGAPGPELLLLEPTRLRVLDARGALVREISLNPPLPLPPRTRDQSRFDLAADWSGQGKPEALLPDVSGFRLVALDGSAPPRSVPVPVTALYGDPPPRPPVRRGLFQAVLLWPHVFRVDDDGDGRRDLIATTRYALTTYRGSASGFPDKPSRMRRFPAFPFEEERRADSNLLLPDFGDLDGDGDADLIVHRTVGTLTGSRAETRVHVNPGGGADPLAPAVGTLTVEGGVATAELADLDGDGRAEIVQSVLPFGALQLLRILTRRQAELELHVYGFAGAKLGQPTLRWSGEVALPFDLGTARVTAMLPTFAGDWNGDGRKDLAYGDGDGSVRLRLGEPGPRFGPEAASLALPTNGGGTLVFDLDGDHLDDLVAWDPLERAGRLRVARNLGVLPGSPARMTAPRR